MAETSSRDGAEHAPSLPKTSAPALREGASVDPAFTEAAESVASYAAQLQAAAEKLGKEVAVGREKEQSYWNFVSPENAMGFSTYLTGDKTFTGAKLDTLVQAHEASLFAVAGAKKLSQMLASGQSLEEAAKIPLIAKFFAMPEGKMLVSMFQGADPREIEANFNLEKARFLKSL
jgi:hypothetical protein